MKTILAKLEDFQLIKQYYWDIIDGMQDVEYPTKWQKGIYPDDDSLKGFITRGELYLVIDYDQIIGSMAINHESSDGYDQGEWKVDAKKDELSVIHILGVHPSYQGKGVAKHLVDEAIRIAKEQNQKVIRLDALSDNIPAQHLYTKKGFEYCGSVNLYYENTGNAVFYLYENVI